MNTGITKYHPGLRTRVSITFLLLALVCLIPADIEVYPSDPWGEFGRLLSGLLSPGYENLNDLAGLLINTVSFAILGVAASSLCGFLLALNFHYRIVRVGCAFARAVHELFWALMLMQLFGLSALTGILAIAIPYSGIFAKIYSEILEEVNSHQRDKLFARADRLSRFLYSGIPDVWVHLKTYTLYRMECGLRSSAILGFIGLPTLGFYLESAFSQGNYSEVWVLLLVFYLVISTIGIWMRRSLLPFYLIASLILLPQSKPFSLDNIIRFFSHDIIPYPLRTAEWGQAETFIALSEWFWSILTTQALPGIWNTLLLTQIALATTGILTLLFFPMVSAKFFSRVPRTAGHLFLVILRSTPEYILAYILLQLWGPSMLPAIVAIALHNGAIIGHLVGRHSSEVKLRIDTTKKRLNRYCFEVVPRVYGPFLSFLFYRWEVIFRETAILGLLGIYTLGFYIDSAIQDLRMDRAMLLILITAVINVFIDWVSRRLRSKLRLNYGAML